MKSFIKIVTFLMLVTSTSVLSATKGLVIGCNDDYLGYFLPSLAYLRKELKCNLPIEVWYAGDELSQESKTLINKFSNVTFHDCIETFGGKAEDYWGYQIKGYMLKGSNFDEVMIVDADVFFAKNPEELFQHHKYIDTGAFFFRDHLWLGFSIKHDDIGDTEKGASALGGWYKGFIESYWLRRDFFCQLIESPSKYLPDDMRFFWENVEPTATKKLLLHYQESGVVLIDRTRHEAGVEQIVRLNINHEETYRYVLGDKETFWLGMEMAKEPYSFNDGFPMMIKGKRTLKKRRRKQIDLSHKVDGELFWFQKKPVSFGLWPEYNNWEETLFERLTKEDVNKLNHIGYYVSMYGRPTIK